MESLNGSSSLKNFSFSNKQSIMDSTSPFLQSYADQNIDRSKGKAKPNEGLTSHHHRCNSESFLIEEQPSWLDDLLNEPPETTTVLLKGHHRRSASDTFAYLGATAERSNMREEAKNKNVNVGASWGSVNYASYKDLSAVSNDTKPSSSHEQKFNKAAQEVNGAPSVSHEKHNREMNNSQNQEGSSERSNNVQAKHSMSKADARRAKQQSAHRSRVRKLQHIAELERTVQALQAEGSELSAELEFLDQQNIILSMENRALRQRLDSLSQEQLIKHCMNVSYVLFKWSKRCWRGNSQGYKLCIRCRGNNCNNSISSRRSSRTTLNIVETKAEISMPNLPTSLSRTMKPVPAGRSLIQSGCKKGDSFLYNHQVECL